MASVPTSGIPGDLILAVERHRTGQFQQADTLYRKVLRRYPDHPDALHLMGVLAYDRGHAGRAIQLISKALKAIPASAEAHSNLGNAMRATGAFIQAEESYRHALALKPEFAAAHNNLARLLNDQHRHAEARECCRRALELDPSLPEAHANIGIAAERLGLPIEAEAAYRRAIKLSEDKETLAALGRLLAATDRIDEAESYFERALSLQSDHPPSLCGLGFVMRRRGNLLQAILNYRRAVVLDPKSVDGWNGLGAALRGQGKFKEAADCFRRALTINPGLGESYRGLAGIGEQAGEDDEARLRVLAGDTCLSAQEQISAGFALGRILDANGRFDAAFEAYAKANMLFRSMASGLGHIFEAQKFDDQVDALVRLWTTDEIATLAQHGEASELPVFIVGMPRSGTTLVEQILASHSQVWGGGEMPEVGRLEQMLTTDTPLSISSQCRDAARQHLARLQTLGKPALRVIDKMPDNILRLGLIACLYPRARIIVCQRDPRDTVLSCFFQRFSGYSQLFSYDLVDCAARSLALDRLMAYWRAALPLRMIEVSYEALVADMERQSRRLVEFLDLRWEPECLEFHRTERPVLTASAWQVRQPLNARSIGRWQNYQEHLGSLLQTLRTKAI